MMGKIRRLCECINNIQKQNSELLWAKIWDDTKSGIEWMEGFPSISPGRWAVGYNYIYVMTRILNELRPKHVLEMGLGVSTTLISHYIKKTSGETCTHDVIEQDADWIDFYVKNGRVSDVTNVIQSSIVKKQFDGTEYYAYEDLSCINHKKYNLISIDGPWGSDRHSRRDILEFIPYILGDNWIIVLDDTNRVGERDTVNEIIKKLKESGIDFCIGEYSGMSQCTIIADSNNRFLCSM